MWSIFFKQKEKEMPQEPQTYVVDDNSELRQTINEQNTEISRLQDRVSSLTDELHLVTNDLNLFKKNVANDINQLFDKFQ